MPPPNQRVKTILNGAIRKAGAAERGAKDRASGTRLRYAVLAQGALDAARELGINTKLTVGRQPAKPKAAPKKARQTKPRRRTRTKA